MVLGVRSKKKLKEDVDVLKNRKLQRQVLGRSNLRVLERNEERRIKREIVNRKGGLFFDKPSQFKTFFKNGRQEVEEEFSKFDKEEVI